MKRPLVLLALLVTLLPTVALAAPSEITRTPRLPEGATPIEIYPGLTMLYWSLEDYEEYSGPRFIGEARWDGPGTIDAPAVAIAVKDADGNVLATGIVFPVQYTVESGKRIAYDYRVYGIDELSFEEMDRVEVSGCADTGTTVFAEQYTAELGIRRTNVRVATPGQLELVVDVENRGTAPADNVAGLVLIYDEDGYLIDTARDHVGATVEPGKFGRVTLSASPGEADYQYRVMGIQAGFANMAFC